MPIQCAVVYVRHSAEINGNHAKNYTGSGQIRPAGSRLAQTHPKWAYLRTVPVSGLEPPTY